MTDIKAIIEKLDTAWSTKDEAAMRELLHENYEFKGPLMSFDGPDQAIMAMKFFPLVSKSENRQVIAEGNKAANSFDCVITAPFQVTIPMVELLELEDGKIRKARLFFDTNLFPAEILAMMRPQMGA